MTAGFKITIVTVSADDKPVPLTVEVSPVLSNADAAFLLEQAAMLIRRLPDEKVK